MACEVKIGPDICQSTQCFRVIGAQCLAIPRQCFIEQRRSLFWRSAKLVMYSQLVETFQGFFVSQPKLRSASLQGPNQILLGQVMLSASGIEDSQIGDGPKR